MNQLALSSSFRDGADPFLQGECVLVRFPIPLNIEDSDTLVDQRPLPPTSGGSSPQHFAFIRSSLLRDDASYDVNAYPIVSFSNQGGALSGYNALTADVQAFLIPLPPLSTHHPTPITFGNPINLIGGFSLGRDTWLFVKPYRFIMPEDRGFRRWNPQVRLSHRQLHQIDNYRNALQNLPAVTNDKNGPAQLPSGDRSTSRGRGRGGRGGGGSGRRGGSGRGRGGGGRGQGTFGNNSRPRTRSQGQERGGEGANRGRGQGTVVGRDRKNLWTYSGSPRRSQGNVMSGELMLAPEELEYLVTEDVDDDPRGANATFKDDLMLLAGPGDDGLWRRELTKLLQAEREEIREQSVGRVHDWLHLK